MKVGSAIIHRKDQRLIAFVGNLAEDGSFVAVPGLQSMLGTYGFQSWLSLPHFLLAGDDLTTSFSMKPDFSKHLPYVSFSQFPITISN
jgi:hypothetical protein